MNKDSRFLLTAISVLLFFSTAQAQQDTLPAPDTMNSALPDYFGAFDNMYSHPLRKTKVFDGSLITADMGLQYSSNCLVNDAALSFYLKSHVSGNSINNSIKNLSAENTANRDILVSFKYLMPIKKGGSDFIYFNYGYRSFLNMKFSDEVAKFIGQGNSQFAGKEINGNGLESMKQKYDFFQVGWMKYFILNGRYANFSAGVSLVRGAYYFSLNAPQVKIFTEENGEYIKAHIDATAYKSSYYDFDLIHVNGYGGMLDMRFNTALSHNTGITAELTDLGFVSWKHEAGYYSKDTTVTFDGVFVPHLDSLAHEEYVNRIGDSIINRFNAPLVKSSYTKMLPFRFNLFAYVGVSEKSYINIRLKAIGASSYRPQLSLEYQHFFNTKLYSTSGIALGGYGAMDLYETVGWQINKKFFAGLSLYGIEGMLAPKKLSGLGGGISAAFRL